MHDPKITISRTFGGKGKEFLDVAQASLPEEYMDKYKKLLGDGAAKVTVSADMALKEFGSGAGAMVSVSLSCNQDQESIESAVDMAGQLARSYCVEQHKLAEKDLQESRQSPKQGY